MRLDTSALVARGMLQLDRGLTYLFVTLTGVLLVAKPIKLGSAQWIYQAVLGSEGLPWGPGSVGREKCSAWTNGTDLFITHCATGFQLENPHLIRDGRNPGVWGVLHFTDGPPAVPAASWGCTVLPFLGARLFPAATDV